jgi:hypothetical protein
MMEYSIGLLSGAVIGSATVIYITSLTRSIKDVKKRLRIILWLGVPLGVIMSVLAQYIGRNVL